MESVRLVGPTAPATYRCLPDDSDTSSAARLANRADSMFNLIMEQKAIYSVYKYSKKKNNGQTSSHVMDMFYKVTLHQKTM